MAIYNEYERRSYAFDHELVSRIQTDSLSTDSSSPYPTSPPEACLDVLDEKYVAKLRKYTYRWPRN